MPSRGYTAPDERRQLKNRDIYKSNQRWYSEFSEFLRERPYCMIVLAMCAIVPCIFPESFDFARILFLGVALFYYVKTNKFRLPLRLPGYANIIDYSDPKPGRKAYNLASAFFYLGNDIYGRELWLKDTDIKTHMLIYGTTGSGKTVTLQSLSYNAMAFNTGLCYIDPKGDSKLAHELFIAARRVNREDDFLAMDFMTGGKKPEPRTPFRMSNTTNPFATAQADAIVNLLISLLPKDDGSNSVFQQKASALLTALVPVLTDLRDAKQALPLTDMSGVMANDYWRQGNLGMGMSIATIRDYLDPLACIALVFPLKKGAHGSPNKPGSQASAEYSSGPSKPLDRDAPFDPATAEECDIVKRYVDPARLDVLKATLSSLNYVHGKDDPKKQQAFLDQFGYAKGYFGQPLASISGMYGHLFNVSSGEIDMYDVLFDRRIMIAILPSLEKSPMECENLGKIILASVKNAVSGALGSRLEGSTREVMGARSSSARTPGIIVVDEYAAIMMPGFEIILTQARSLGFMAVIASQDYGGMKGKDAKSCDQIIENTAVKLFMRMASAGETWDLIKKLFGQVNVEEINLTRPGERGSIKVTDKVTQYDLMEQREGEFHAFFGGDLIRGETKYMVPSVKDYHFMRINRFIRTDCAPEKVLENIAAETEKLSHDTKADDMAWMTRVRNSCVISEICGLELELDEAA